MISALVVRRPALVRILAARLRNTADAEDIAQEALLSAWRWRRTFNPSKQSAWGWLLVIAVRLANRYAMRRARTPRVRVQGGQAVEGLEPKFRAALAEGMHALPPFLRRALVDVHLRGHSYATASRRLRARPGALRWRVCEARRRLRVHMRRKGFEVDA